VGQECPEIACGAYLGDTSRFTVRRALPLAVRGAGLPSRTPRRPDAYFASSPILREQPDPSRTLRLGRQPKARSGGPSYFPAPNSRKAVNVWFPILTRL
jgi:hypothetical protein